ncbi:sigma-70 family RNA polymerase sigma factor [Oscillatoria sp. CS-180]|uniref:RNA polymerase sigma factor n=1 Tax=Oscillatoria sp. CS-180 TaxID=3021720 RepID=UPI00232F4989|nr:sigma-70 family RNA polymerase sigma factor [Oscillatoria sp. CS-180]MDB9529938.1 sigma-70 family RNA polymerase sigma factor [Oscillatoria sp. CS-180]
MGTSGKSWEDKHLHKQSDITSLSKQFADEHIVRQWHKFNETFEEIMNRRSASASSIFPFIRSKLLQYELWPRYDEAAILQEIYLRTLEKIQEGRTITNHYAWIRSVAFRYIQELSRKHRRDLDSEPSSLEILMSPKTVDEDLLTDEMLKVGAAFVKLSKEEQLLLSLKSIQNLSWPEVQRAWIDRGYGELSLSTLRKRKERALSHLRMIYHSL